ncbi:hypothetical protein CHS0354_015784 [Potamilus streckersoni]|uniref:WD repeat-containing protein 55 n=1 Tax=Potamilus streckersoni TaxID=2493646 RepID=A0AAE0RQH4_9BIVA|nr:hypothetical protein CHS0354_015784 [Potamilus streckersoni]
MATKDANDEEKKPKDIELADIVIDVDFHPIKSIVAAGTIEGEIIVYSYSCDPAKENKELQKSKHHKKSCRSLRFSPSGEELHSVSKDKSIKCLDLNTGKLKRKIKNAHESPIYSICMTGENFIATGDDDGTVKVWDLRKKTAVMELKQNDDFISDMAIDSHRKILLATSGDGTLIAFNIRKRQMELQSELFDSEFLSVAIVKGEKKVVCGCGNGELNIFNWSEWGNISDRFPGHPLSIDCMVAITEDIICTGSCDGMIRAVNILPNRFLGIVGIHEEEFPIENLSLSWDKSLLASCSHDTLIKFWDIEDVKSEIVDTSKKAKKTNKPKFLSSAKKDNFFADLADEDDKKCENTDDEEDTDDGDENSTDQDDSDEETSDDKT